MEGKPVPCQRFTTACAARTHVYWQLPATNAGLFNMDLILSTKNRGHNEGHC